MTEADLDRVAARVRERPAMDISPRGISPRPDPELDALLGGLGDESVAQLERRLADEKDALMALTWLRALIAIGTPSARAAIDAYAERLRRHDPWKAAFPGGRELLRFLGEPPA
jgi:hypothetical protein